MIGQNSGPLKTSLRGKRVCATGQIRDYRGRPEIILSDPNDVLVRLLCKMRCPNLRTNECLLKSHMAAILTGALKNRRQRRFIGNVEAKPSAAGR
jgi:DNA/RNA endonuclease YhcR with UshA esterase domain